MFEIDANGETLAYRREGAGPALVLVHSLGTNSNLWDAQFAHWPKRFDVIAFDARGHGGSSNRGGVSMRNIASDIGAALKLMGVGRAHFAGISMGGLICSRLYERDPSLFETITISGSFVSIEGGAARVKMLESRITKAGLDQYGREYAAETLLPDTPREHHEALSRWIAGMKLEDYLQTVRSIFTEDVEACMRTMKIPARVLVGDKDQRTPLAAAERMAKTIPGASLHVIEDAAHLANLDQPGRFNAAVEGLIGG